MTLSTQNNLNPKLTLEEFNQMVPSTFTIETALACNLRCPECAIGGEMIGRAKNLMRWEKFKEIADKIRPFAKYVYLHLWGEPLLNKKIFEMIAYVSEFARTNISTNALLLDQEKAKKLINSGVSDIIVSIDGFSQAVYEQYRVGGDVQKALQALVWLQEENLATGNKVSLSPQFIVFKHNQHEMPLFREFANMIGLQPSFKAPYIRTGSGRFENSDYPELIRKQYPTLQALKKGMMHCTNPKEVFTVLSDGAVVVCCHDYDKATYFGNIFEQDVMQIWNSDKYRQYRWDILSGNAPEFCIKNCMTFVPAAGCLPAGEESSCKKEAPPEPLVKLGSGKRQISKSTDTKVDGYAEAKLVALDELPETKGTESVKNGAELNVNLCSGSVRIPGFVNVDIGKTADYVIDLEKELLPFEDNSVDSLVCMSAINYFERRRAAELIKDVFRVLKPGGKVRFGVQDLKVLARHYIEDNKEFWFQKTADGSDRFPGRTMAEKFNEFFTGFTTDGQKNCRFVYDYETLELYFKEAGFGSIAQKRFNESSFEQIDKIDNRPDQMFYLEAAKAAESSAASKKPSHADDYYKAAEELWAAGKKAEAWQNYIFALHLEPSNKKLVLRIHGILMELKRFDHAQQSLQNFLKVAGNDPEIENLLKQTITQAAQTRLESAPVFKAPEELEYLNRVVQKSLSDKEHLEACLTWLSNAQVVNGVGGVSAIHRLLDSCWEVDYPETTGYIIPTFLSASKLLSQDALIGKADLMGKWECSIHDPEGGIGEPLGVYGHRPRVFNTSQVMLGWMSLYNTLSKPEFLESAVKAGDWIVGIQEADGRWIKNTYQGPRSYHSRTAWALAELGVITGDPKYKEAARKSFKWVLSLGQSNGWFKETSLTDPEKPWTHLIAYTLVGLVKGLRYYPELLDADLTGKLLFKAARELQLAYQFRREQFSLERYSGFPGTMDSLWLTTDNWSCITGDAQLAFFLREAALLTGNKSFAEVSDMVINELKSIHIINTPDKNLYGALTGAYPVNGGYCAYMLPNWGVKFFSDSLIQKINDRQDTRLLG